MTTVPSASQRIIEEVTSWLGRADERGMVTHHPIHLPGWAARRIEVEEEGSRPDADT